MAKRSENSGANPQSQHIKKSIMKRVVWLYVVFAVAAMAVFVMILITQFGPNGTPLRNRSDYKCYKMLDVPASRGNIYAHDGRILATDSPSFNITVDFSILDMDDDAFSRQARALADSLAATIPGYSREFFYKRLNEIHKKAKAGGPGSQSQMLVRDKVNQIQLDRIKTFPIFNKGRLGGGLIYTQDAERYKPFGTLAARTIGKPGEFGLEASFNDVLSGHDGRNLCVRLVRDVWVPVVDKDNIEARNGRDLHTTIDVNMQDIAESELRKQILAHNATAGTAVIMDVETGEIRAISNLTRYGGTVRDDENHAVMMRTEPGSTFKLVSLMALVEEAGYDLNVPVDCTTSGKYYYETSRGRKYLVQDSHPVGKTTLLGAMEESSNIGFVKLIDSEYHAKPQRFTDFIRGLNIDRAVNIQLSGGLKPVIKDPSRPRETAWDAISLMKMSYGYAIELSPIHTLMLYNAVANGGKMVAPKLVTEISENGRAVQRFDTEVVNEKICSDRTLALVRQSLEGVVENGTGAALKNKNYKIAGKTGTAQIAMKNRGYADEKGGRDYLATFVGYFPADKPKYTCIVAIKTYNGPGARNTYYGASLALPVFKAIADRVFALEKTWQAPLDVRTVADTVAVKGGNMHEMYVAADRLDIPTNLRRRDDGWGAARPDSAGIIVSPIPVKADTVPNVVGMGLKDALYLMERQGLKVKAAGTGKVTSQSLAPGKPAARGETVTLTLRPADEKPKPAQPARRR